jgi:Predicted HD superfamily hydrolase
MKLPSMQQAELLLDEAEKLNPGAWIAHSKTAGTCAKIISEKCENLDPDISRILGLLHDIGRRFGITDLHHIIDGYNFMTEQGFDDCARICLTHSFPYKDIASYNGRNDCTDRETAFIRDYLNKVVYDDYDKLIQLCDALAFPDGAVYIEKRLVDVAIRRGINEFTIPKWKEFLELKKYFDQKTSSDIYRLLGVK